MLKLLHYGINKTCSNCHLFSCCFRPKSYFIFYFEVKLFKNSSEVNLFVQVYVTVVLMACGAVNANVSWEVKKKKKHS